MKLMNMFETRNQKKSGLKYNIAFILCKMFENCINNDAICLAGFIYEPDLPLEIIEDKIIRNK